MCLIRKEPTHECYHCDGLTVDMEFHAPAECPAWNETRRDLVAALRERVLSVGNTIAALSASKLCL